MIPHNRPTLGVEEEEAALRVLRSGWVAQGEEVVAFENEICAYLGLPDGHAVAVTSGTAAIYLALWSMGAEGKRVAIPAYVCSSLRHAVAMAGGEEVLMDSSSESPNVDPEVFESDLADIIIAPHLYGIPMEIPDSSGMEIIEDCAQALGSTINGEPVGLKGRAAVFSFYATKLLTSGGQGGMFVSKEKGLTDAVRDYREFDCRRDSNKRFNFQMTESTSKTLRVFWKK